MSSSNPRFHRILEALAVSLPLWIWPGSARADHVNVIELNNQIISPVTQQYITDAIDRSETDGAVGLIIQLDTPGGLLESTRAIVKRMMNAKVPIAVYVAPSGSRAGSAGVFITLAAHVAAMAPSTNIGAAHPVVVGEGSGSVKRLIRRITRDAQEEFHADEQKPRQAARGQRPNEKPGKPAQETIEEETESDPMSEKIINDTVAWITTIAAARGRNDAWAKKAVTESFSITETDAVKERVVDFIAADLPDLLAKMDGRRVNVAGVEVELHTAKAQLIRHPLSKRQEFLATITHPNVAYLLMLFGVLGLIFEFTHPGIAFPGIAGIICLLLALYALQTLPVSIAALALLILGLGLLLLEIKAPSHGLLAVSGIVALTLGSLMLFESPDPSLRVSLHVVMPTVATLAAVILFVVGRALRAQRYRVTTGAQGLIGQIGTVSKALNPTGTVFVHGELWDADSAHPVKAGERVRVLRVDGLHLTVKPVDSSANGGGR